MREHGLQGAFVVGAVLLGAGHGGLGEVASADVMMRAIRSMAEAPCAIGEVRFAVLHERTATLVARAAEKHGIPLAVG